MGELLLCVKKLAAIPFYLENVSLNIYSLEELCYCLKSDPDLFGAQLMTNEFCSWVSQQLKEEELANRLSIMIEKKALITEFITAIMESSRYCTKDEISQIRQALQEFEYRSEFECRKIRADRLLKGQKYVKAIAEYRQLLECTEFEKQSEEMQGNIWNNLGTANAGLFCFQEAAGCFRQAFLKNKNPDCRQAYLISLSFLKEKDQKKESEYGMTKEEYEKALAQRDACLLQKDGWEESMQSLEEMEQGQFEEKARGILEDWKEEYRKSCRM